MAGRLQTAMSQRASCWLFARWGDTGNAWLSPLAILDRPALQLAAAGADAGGGGLVGNTIDVSVRLGRCARPARKDTFQIAATRLTRATQPDWLRCPATAQTPCPIWNRSFPPPARSPKPLRAIACGHNRWRWRCALRGRWPTMRSW